MLSSAACAAYLPDQERQIASGPEEMSVNKAELIEAVAGRIGDRRTATSAVEAVLHTVQRTLLAGEKVALSGFGVFEKVDRAARTARNPATGAAVQLAATSVPRFRAGQGFKDVISGTRDLPAEPATEVSAPAPRARSRAAAPTAAEPVAAPQPRAAAVTADVPVAPVAKGSVGKADAKLSKATKTATTAKVDKAEKAEKADKSDKPGKAKKADTSKDSKKAGSKDSKKAGSKDSKKAGNKDSKKPAKTKK